MEQGAPVRFDDRLRTVLADPAIRPAAVAAKWRQLVDLLAQGGEGLDPALEAAAYTYLREHRSVVGLAVRQAAATTLRYQRIHPVLVALFAEDHSSVAAPIIGSAYLQPRDWINLLPHLGPTARGLLRHRRDLDLEVERALAAFGASDHVLGGMAATSETSAPPPQETAPVESSATKSQIRDLVERIESFRRHQEEGASRPSATYVETFRWETSISGVMLWVDGAPREPLVGHSIAVLAGIGEHGVDGQAAGAFEKRSPFRDARLSIAGSGPVSGEWRISGIPFFDPASGSFLGYRGTARRPRIDEVAQPTDSGSTGFFGEALPADPLRQLIHELRTPLNAIVGFAEMIEGQYVGPVDPPHRARAAQIMDQAARLLTAIDDLDTAARLETRSLSPGEQTADAVALLCRLHDSYERVAAERHARIAVQIERNLPLARVEPGSAERMFARLLAATIGLAKEGETISATMRMEKLGLTPMLCLAIDRPAVIAGACEAALLDPGYSPEGDWPEAPALGLGFALRLVRNLSEASGGLLVIGSRRFELFLPSMQEEERTSGQGADPVGAG
jgi:hypothetical protein